MLLSVAMFVLVVIAVLIDRKLQFMKEDQVREIRFQQLPENWSGGTHSPGDGAIKALTWEYHVANWRWITAGQLLGTLIAIGVIVHFLS